MNTFCGVSKAEPDSAPRASRRSGRKESCLSKRKFAVYGGQWPSNEPAGICKSGRAELGGAVVFPIEQIIGLNKQFRITQDLVASAKVHHRVAGRLAGSEIVCSVSLVKVVLIAARVGA